MKTVKEGDKYLPENNEVVNIEYRGNTYTCICITDVKTLHALCIGCPLYDDIGICCSEWLSFRTPHRVIPVEEVVE